MPKKTVPYYDNNTLLHKIVLVESWSSPVNSIRVEMRKKNFNSIVIVGTSSPLVIENDVVFS